MMVHDTKFDGSKLTTTLFINRAALPNLAGVTVTAKQLPGGAEPGPDAEIFVEVTFPKAVPIKPVVKPVPLTPAQVAAKAEADAKAKAEADAKAKAAAVKV